MPRSKDNNKEKSGSKSEFKGSGIVVEQPIIETLETNFMPYVMSVIVSRAIPEIDGFKPSHRKLLYTMYKMGLLTGHRTKSANVVGQTMKLNPHGDLSIYETLVRLTRGNEALIHPYIDSKGNFGKFYSSGMAYAASRYTEIKLDAISAELFRDIDKDTVDFVDNYDNTIKEPTLFPTSFPSILVNSTMGIAVGMASSICSFNLAEVCETTIKLLKNPSHDISTTLKAPDFAGSGLIIYDKPLIDNIYKTGRGSFKVRSRYSYDKSNNCIDITEIPPTTTIEAIIDKVVELVKLGKIKDITEIRDETDLSGLKITIDLKRGTDPERLMQNLFRQTPLEDSFGCNFNVLIAGTPRVMGVEELLLEWTAFRSECVRRRLYFDLNKCKEKLHLLKGLAKILLDIDKAIRIVRETEEENEVVPNLMIGFGIDNIQAEFVAEIKLRQLNHEYILKRTNEISQLEKDISELTGKLADKTKIHQIIIDELRDIIKKYGKPRKSVILYDVPDNSSEPEDEIADYPCTLFVTRDGYFKKITAQSLRMAGEQKLKEGDVFKVVTEATNRHEVLFFSDKCQVYKSKVSDFDDMKASQLGEYIPSKLGFDEGESLAFMVLTTDYSGFMLFFFENGKVSKVDMTVYATKTNRKKLIGAYFDASPLVASFYQQQDSEFVLTASSGKILIMHSGAVSIKTTRNSQGVNVLTLKPGQRVLKVVPYVEGSFKNPHRYKVKSLPAAGQTPAAGETRGEQLLF
jgi:DNA gyrase subunit A